MALKWIIGDFKTGSISEADEIPVIKSNAKISIDINGGDQAVISTPISELSTDWRNYFKPIEKFVALVDDSRSYTDGVLWAGFIRKNSAPVKGVVRTQVAGLREYLALRQISDVFDSTQSDPNAGITFSASDWQGVMKGAVESCFDASGIPTGKPTPPQVLGTVSGSTSGSTISKTALYSDFWTYQEFLDDIRDIESPGNEYYFKARWKDSNKDAIVWDCIIAADSTPHLGESSTTNITVADNAWRPIALDESYDAAQIASRIVAQSKGGDGTAGSIDYTTITNDTFTDILIDQAFNPGVELTPGEMAAQLTSRISYAQNVGREANFSRVYDDIDDLLDNLGRLGNLINITGTEEATYFDIVMRLVGIDFYFDSKKVEFSLMAQAPRYPKLPKNKNPFMTPSPVKPPMPPSGGGITPPEIPPFEIPTFGEESPLTLDGVNRCSSASQAWNTSGGNGWAINTIRPKTIADDGRFIYGLNVASEVRGSSSFTTFKRIYVYDLEGAAWSTSLSAEPAVQTTTSLQGNSIQFLNFPDISSIIPNFSDTDVDFAGTTTTSYIIDSSAEGYQTLNLPGKERSLDYQIIISDSKLYLRVLATIYNNVFENGEETPRVKFKVKENVWSVSRNPSTGLLGTSWTDEGPLFTDTVNDVVFWSPVVHWYEGKFHAVGGYFFPSESLSGEKVFRSAATFAQQFYRYDIFTMNEDGTGKSRVQPSIPFSDTGTTVVSKLPRAFYNLRPNLLAVRFRDDQVVVSGGTTFKGRREYFYANIHDYSFSKVMDSNDLPELRFVNKNEFKMIPETSLSAEIVGDTIIDLIPQGEVFTSSNITSRGLVALRGKVGFTDTVKSLLELPDTASYNYRSGISGTSQMGNYLPLFNETKTCGHTMTALASVLSVVPVRRYRPTVTTYVQFSRVNGQGDSSLYFGASPYSLWTSTTSWNLADYINQSYGYSTKTGDFLYGSGGTPTPYPSASWRPVSCDWWWKIYNGKVYIMSYFYSDGGGTYNDNYSLGTIARFSIDSSNW